MTDAEFYTATMAKVYEQQGLLEKAADIYRFILEREPGRTEVGKALAELENKIDESAPKSDRDLMQLFSKWIELVLSYKRVQALKKIEDSLQLAAENLPPSRNLI